MRSYRLQQPTISIRKEDDREKLVEKPQDPGPPPDGGLTAWLQVLGAFFLNFNTWGLVNTFGVFQDYYSTGPLASTSNSAISWLGSIQGFLMLVIGVLCGRAVDAGYLQLDLGLGICVMVFGMMMTSICEKYWQFVLAQGVVAGLGSGATFIPAITVVGTYFSSKRSLAVGFATTGSSVGGTVYPIMLRYLIREIGFGWAVRTMSFTMLATLCFSFCVMKKRLPPRKSGPILDFSAFKDPAYVSYLLSVFLTYTGLYVMFFYVEGYALSLGIDDTQAFYMLIYLNAASVIGRIVPPFVADKTGNLSILIPSTLFSAIMLFAWISVDEQKGLIAITVLFGFISGSIQAVVPAGVAQLCPDMSKFGTRLGMTLAVGGTGLLIGSPIGGAIHDGQSKPGDEVFWGMLLFCGLTVLAGACLQMLTRVLKYGFSLQKG